MANLRQVILYRPEFDHPALGVQLDDFKAAHLAELQFLAAAEACSSL